MSCSSCGYANEADAPEGYAYCTNRLSFYAHAKLPGTATCAHYAPRCTRCDLDGEVVLAEDGGLCSHCAEPTAAWLEAQSREAGGESEAEREARLLTERGGRVGGTW